MPVPSGVTSLQSRPAPGQYADLLLSFSPQPRPRTQYLLSKSLLTNEGWHRQTLPLHRWGQRNRGVQTQQEKTTDGHFQELFLRRSPRYRGCARRNFSCYTQFFSIKN